MPHLSPSMSLAFGASLIALFFGCSHIPQTHPALAKMVVNQKEAQKDRVIATDQNDFSAFRVVVNLSLRCQGESSEHLVESAREIFYPEESPLAEANGGLVPLLTTRLQMMADRLALEAANRICGSRRVETVVPIEIRSGKWKAALPLSCGNEECIRSPYDPSQRGSVEFVKSASLRKQIIPHRALKEWNSNTSPNCSHVIHAQACFGDCVSAHSTCSSKGEFVETLLSPNPEVDDKLEICGDPLFSRLAAERVPTALRPLECRIYFLNEVIKRSYFALSCSAFRVKIPDCDSF